MIAFEKGDTVRHRSLQGNGVVTDPDPNKPSHTMVDFNGVILPCRDTDLVLVRANGPSLRLIQGGVW
jgi:hypothetical protein